MNRPKILLVDDTKLVLELEKSFLKCSNVDVITASNGVEALELIRKDPPDLVFMDVNMPVMDGIACCTLLKADPFLSGIPIVMLTTAGKEEDRERARQAGCDDFLTKPIDRRLFLDMARRYTDAVDRRAVRVPCQFPILFLLGKSVFGAHALDVSEGGVFISTREEIAPQRRISIAFYVPAPVPVLMELKGKVAWVNPPGKRVHTGLPAGFGVEFVDLEEKENLLLRGYLEAAGAHLLQDVDW